MCFLRSWFINFVHDDFNWFLLQLTFYCLIETVVLRILYRYVKNVFLNLLLFIFSWGSIVLDVGLILTFNNDATNWLLIKYASFFLFSMSLFFVIYWFSGNVIVVNIIFANLSFMSFIMFVGFISELFYRFCSTCKAVRNTSPSYKSVRGMLEESPEKRITPTFLPESILDEETRIMSLFFSEAMFHRTSQTI